MIRLRDSVLIHVPPERVWAWLNDLPTHYREWHPAHVTCRYEHGDRLEVGAVLYAEEVVHNRLHRLRLQATEVVPGRALRYRGHGFTGAFLVEPANGDTSFTAELAFGIRLGGLGSILDAILRTVFGRRLATFQTHMQEEGVNLKRLLEGEHVHSSLADEAAPRRVSPQPAETPQHRLTLGPQGLTQRDHRLRCGTASGVQHIVCAVRPGLVRLLLMAMQ